MKRAAFARINLSYLKNNLAAIQQVANSSRIMAVVKADAYGHGMLEVCKCLHDADAFSVAYVNEAMELRESGITTPIVALQGFSSDEDLQNAITDNIQVVIHHQEQLKILKQYSGKAALDVFIKIDTGMHRLGFDIQETSSVLNQVQSLLQPTSCISLMTHLACADELENPATQNQIKLFDKVTTDKSLAQTIANSAAILAWPQSHRDWVRPGLLLYGINPIQQSMSTQIELNAVMSLNAPVISIKKCKKGEKIGYGGDFCCPHDMVIGIIAVGYADGYPRHLKHAPNVAIGAKLAKVVGRVSMDMITVDLTNIDARIGDMVELWGESVEVSEVAEYAETISYELLCAAGNAVEKIYTQ